MSDAAILTLVSGLITVTTMVVGFLTLWVNLKYGAKKAEEAAVSAKVVENKLDDNTRITRAGTQAAASQAATAARNSSETRDAVKAASDNLDRKLNGGLDAAIDAAMKPMRDMLQDHAVQFQEIRTALADIKKGK